jgi:hypothetical protein
LAKVSTKTSLIEGHHEEQWPGINESDLFASLRTDKMLKYYHPSINIKEELRPGYGRK